MKQDGQRHGRPFKGSGYNELDPAVILLSYLATTSEDINLSAPFHPLQPPSLPSSASEGDLAYLSVCVSATPGPISDTSCRLCINQMPHKTNSGWSVWNACSVQYVNNHMQIIRPCFSIHANADAYEKRVRVCVLTKNIKSEAVWQIQLWLIK